MPGIVVALGQFQNLFVTFMGPGASFNPWQLYYLSSYLCFDIKYTYHTEVAT